jgi:ABC-type branched-subunit amino acid transport system substrate-binding protein
VYPRGPGWADVVQAIDVQAGKHGWPAPLRFEYVQGRLDADNLARRLQVSGIEALFFFGATHELLALTREAARLTWTPYVLLPGSLTGKDIFKAPAAFQDKIFLAYATAASDHSRAGVQALTALQRQHGLSRKHLPAQIAAYAAAKVLVEGLKRAGRSLSRHKLIATLEKMHAYETGLTPRLTYGPNRHIGALGAHILALDLAAQRFGARSAWIEPE